MCKIQNWHHAQCVPSTIYTRLGATSGPHTASIAATITAPQTPIVTLSTSATTTLAKPSAAASSATQPTGVRFAGVNIAGFDFGCVINGTCNLSFTQGPVKGIPPSFDNPDGPGQMRHFLDRDGMNIFRMPVAWQFLVNNVLGGPLDRANFGYYDKLVQSCLALSGVYCIIDVS